MRFHLAFATMVAMTSAAPSALTIEIDDSGMTPYYSHERHPLRVQSQNVGINAGCRKNTYQCSNAFPPEVTGVLCCSGCTCVVADSASLFGICAGPW